MPPFGSTSTTSSRSTRCRSEPTSITRVAVDLPIGPSITVETFRHQPAQRFRELLRIADISDIGVGWYHIEVSSGPCHGAFWVRVYGRSPLTTVIGIGGVVLLATGVGLLVMSCCERVAGIRHSSSGVAGGLIAGIALCLLAQQFSLVAFTPLALGTFLGGGAAAGAGTSAVGSGVGGGAGAAQPTDVSPPPAGEPPPSPAAPSSPSPSAPSPPAPGPPPATPVRHRRPRHPADLAGRAIAATLDPAGDSAISVTSTSTSRAGAGASQPRRAEPC